MVVLAGLSPVLGQTVETVIEFTENDLIFSQADGFDLVQVNSPRNHLEGAEGEPLLPVITANVLLPAGAQIVNVRTQVEKETVLDGAFNIQPAQKIVPTSSPKPSFTQPKLEVYTSAKRQRENAVENGSRKIMRGHYMAGIKVYPLDYIPSEGKLILRNRIRVFVDYTPGTDEGRKMRSHKNRDFDEMIHGAVVNPQALDMAQAAEESVVSQTQAEAATAGGVSLMSVPTNTVEYLIITKSEFADEFQVLADWKTKKGAPAQVVTLDWIYNTYTSYAQPQQKIKACIRDYALNKGTLWVVLGGDKDSVLDYDCNISAGGYTESDMPTDLYYSDIDTINWNPDGDAIPCEWAESASIDYTPDVFVGRISANSESQVTAYVNKAIAYEKNSPASNFATKFLMSGVYLWQMVGGASDAEAQSELMWDMYIGFYWNGTKYRFYDTNTDFPGGAAYDVNADHINEQLNAGFNFFHMETHGSYAIWGVETPYPSNTYHTGHVELLTNSGKYTNIATIACYTNGFDKGTCLGEGFTRQPNGGAVSYFGSSRFGWGSYGADPGPSLEFDQTFYYYLLGRDFYGSSFQYGNHLGEVFTMMKESKLSLMSNVYYRWLEFGINLLGDPELPLYSANPLTFSPTYSSQINVASQPLSFRRVFIKQKCVCSRIMRHT
jgi:hypothetical protein